MASRIDLPEPLGSDPFTTAAARSSGVSRHVLERPSIARLTRGVHRAGGIDNLRTRLQGLVLVLPADTAFSCETAAVGWGLRLPDIGPGGRDGLVHVRSSSRCDATACARIEAQCRLRSTGTACR